MKVKYIASIFLVMFIFTGCFKEKPGPISVENKITPTVVNSGDYITWKIKVTNMGGKVKIERVHCREEFISGWATGNYAELDIPFSNSEVKAHTTEIIHSQTSPVFNTGPDDVQLKNTVTVYSDGGTDTDECIYTIKTYYRKTSSPPIIKTLLIHNN